MAVIENPSPRSCTSHSPRRAHFQRPRQPRIMRDVALAECQEGKARLRARLDMSPYLQRTLEGRPQRKAIVLLFEALSGIVHPMVIHQITPAPQNDLDRELQRLGQAGGHAEVD